MSCLEYLGFLLAVITCVLCTSSTFRKIHLPDRVANLTLEDFLCPQSGTIAPNTVLIVTERQNITSGDFCLVENTSNITITAPEQFVVECEYKSGRGFGFFDVSQLHIHNLHFVGCGGLISSSAVKHINSSDSSEFHYYGPGQKSAFVFNHCEDLQLTNMTISSYQGYALIGANLCGHSVFSDVLQQNRTRLASNRRCPVDFSESGSGSFIYYMESTFSSICNGRDNTISINMVSKMNNNPCSYEAFYNDLTNNRKTMPISSGSSFGLTYAQHTFPVQAQLKLALISNVNTFVGSTVILFANLATTSTVTLSALYQSNEGQLLNTFFYFTNHLLGGSQISHSPFIIDNLHVEMNSLHSYPIYFNELVFLNDFTQSYLVSIKNVLITNNDRSQLLYAVSTSTENSGLRIEMENISCSHNNKATVRIPNNAMFNFVNIYNVTILSNVYISADSAVSCIRTAFSNVYLSGINITFANGYEDSGGALQLSDYNSYLFLVEPAHVVFRNNTARLGGAIYADDILRPIDLFSYFQSCTLRLITKTPKGNYTANTKFNITAVDVHLHFEEGNPTRPIFANTFSTLCNSELYEGYSLENDSLLASTHLNEHIFSFMNDFDAKLSFINGLCFSTAPHAQQSNINCTWLDKGIGSLSDNNFSNPVIEMISTYPGKEFLTLYYAFKSDYTSREIENQGTWELNQHTSVAKFNGTSLVAQHFSVSLSVQTNLLPDKGSELYLYMSPRPFRAPQYDTVQLALVHILECPPGFTLSNKTGECECVTLFMERDFDCNVNLGRVSNPSDSWIGYHNGTVYFAAICLPTHCSRDMEVDLSIPNDLCINNHSGNVCGECAPGFSVVFGSDDCHKCSDAWSLTIVLYALAGVFFVFVLFTLNLTVSSGTICGLIIYSNILNLSIHTLLRDVDGVYPIFLRVFVSMLNLDLGFPLCFYNGMTVSAKYGLQFVFPVYLWILVIGLIIACRFSIRLAHKLGHNAVPVLGTLLFFSYSKILSNVYSIFTFQTLYLQREGSKIENIPIWLPSSQPYAEGAHIVLMLFAVVFTILFIAPFTILLTFAFFFVRFRVINKFLPLIDAFSGPFKKKFRFWFGVRLWVIVFLFFLYTLLKPYNTTAVYYSHSIVVMCLVVLQAFLKPFKDKLCRLLDLYYLINYWLIVTTATFLSESTHLYAQTVFSTTMVSLAFVVLIGILLYQFYQVTKKTRMQSAFRARLRGLRRKRAVMEEEIKIMSDTNGPSEGVSINRPAPTTHIYDARRFRDSILDSLS